MLVDDHEIVRSGVSAMLGATEDIRVVAEAESVAHAVREAERTRPDVVVMDIRLVDGSGIEATREIRDSRRSGFPSCVISTTPTIWFVETRIVGLLTRR
jgi:DNA-binding NarL/FixJ family response regulator